MFILFQQNESDNLIKPFTTLSAAIDYAMEDIRVYDKIDGMVQKQDNDDNIVAIISSDRCDSSYIIFKEDINQVR